MNSIAMKTNDRVGYIVEILNFIELAMDIRVQNPTFHLAKQGLSTLNFIDFITDFSTFQYH